MWTPPRTILLLTERAILNVVDQQDVPRIFQRGQRKAGICRVQPQNGTPVQQCIGQHCLSEAAGCADKEHSAALDETVKPLLDSGLYDNASRYSRSSLV